MPGEEKSEEEKQKEKEKQEEDAFEEFIEDQLDSSPAQDQNISDESSLLSNSVASTATSEKKPRVFVVKKLEEDDSDEDEKKNLASMTAVEKAKKIAIGAASAFTRAFVDYGPPYYPGNGLELNLVLECSNPAVKLFRVHNLLNMRINPNFPDNEDLYNTAMHWCARNGHYLALRMLRRAKAEINCLNEMGQSPLGLCVIMQHPPVKREAQLKIAQFLLKEGADVNSRDKGGFCPLDYAAMNQDLELIEMLIAYGANVRRENKTLVAKRHHILKYVYDPECYRVLNERLAIEEEEYRQKEEKIAKINKQKAEEIRIRKLHAALAKRRQQKLENVAKLTQKKKLDEESQARKKRDDAEKAIEDAKRDAVAHDRGKWLKTTTGWNFTPYAVGIERPKTREDFYIECKDKMTKLRIQNDVAIFRERWKHQTGGTSDIEVDWKKQDPFWLEEERQALQAQKEAEMILKSEQEIEQEILALELAGEDDLDSLTSTLSGSRSGMFSI